MISDDVSNCPDCMGSLKYYDNVPRVVKTKWGRMNKVKVKRFRCNICKKVHRKIPNYVLPYKHYELDIIEGVLDGIITPDTYGYENYPCETTMIRWSRDIHHLL